MDGGVLAGRFLVKKQFFARGGFGRDFGGTRFKVHRWFFGFSGASPKVQSISGWTSSIDNVPNVVMRKRDLPG